jgi:hypothetical protein
MDYFMGLRFVIKNYFYDKIKKYMKKFLYGYLAEPKGGVVGGSPAYGGHSTYGSLRHKELFL